MGFVISQATVGLVLAAGAGRRFGGPKALATDDDGETWVRRAARRLHEGGCETVQVVVGAAAAEVRAEVDPEDGVVEAPDWEEGMGASLRAGLAALRTLDPAPDAVVVMLVDLPGVGSDVVARIRSYAGADVLARAAYGRELGHPVLLGRNHWDAIIESARGDRGARDYLAAHEIISVECGDIGTAQDVDHR
jgi:nicotine blue oxidoreductase